MKIVHCFLYDKTVSLTHCKMVSKDCKYRGGTIFQSETLGYIERLHGKEIKVIKPTVCLIDGKFIRGR
jgi:hypothetical protein